MNHFLSLLIVFHLSLVACLAQGDFVTVKADANACELNSLHLDTLRGETEKNPTARIIIKSYGGKTEKAFANEVRVRYLRTFLEENKGFDLWRIEFVNAGPLETDGNPKIEFYIVQPGETDGKLFLTTYSQPNKTPCLDCCAPEFMPKPIGLNSGLQSGPKVQVPEGWKQINAKGLFRFSLPRGAWDTGFSAIDEYYQEWRVGRMRFKVVYEPMGHLSYDSREKVFGKVFKESVVEVSGRKAYLCEYSGLEKGRKRYYTDLYVGEWPQGHVKLWMQADTARPADLETAKKIFNTLEFLRP